MEKITKNVFAETKIRGCNPGYVVTSGGVVVIDTPQLPTRAVKMREEAEKCGPIRFLINTEHHLDHIFGNYYFRGTGVVVAHEEVYRNFMTETRGINPFAYAREAIPTDDPQGASIFPAEEEYWKDPNRPVLTIRGDATLRLGDHTFQMLWTPGHTRGQLAVYIPEEKVIFTGDTIFHNCQTWLQEADPEEWLKSLSRIDALDVQAIVPGHGPICTKAYIPVQSAFIREWMTAVAVGISRGWSKEECIRKISFLDRYPVDIGQAFMGEKIQEMNVSALYDFLRRAG
jgi:cyclase